MIVIVINITKQECDDEYRTTLINFTKYKLIIFAMVKIVEIIRKEQNQIAFYLFNKLNG